MRKIILLLAAGLLLLAGCSNIVQQENDTDSSSGGTAGAFLRVTAETEGFAARKEEASARTALPTIDRLTVEDSFTCTLKGTKEGGSEETLVSGVSFEELEGKQIPVTTGRWSFTLTAEKDGTVFTGTLSDKTITTGDNELSFTISWDESKLSGTGSLAFSLDWSKAGLGSVEAATGTLFAYDPDTGTETATAYTESSGGISLDMAASTVTYSLSDVPAGVYMIRIAFYSDAEKTNLAGTWRELAVITGGQESGADRVMSVFVKHSATIDPMAAGNLAIITENTISVEGIATLTENIDGGYTLTSESMGATVLTFAGMNQSEQPVTVTYNVSVDVSGEIKVGAPVVKIIVTLKTGIEINEILFNYTLNMDLGVLETVQFKKSTTNNDSPTQYLDTDEKIPVWADSGNKIIYYYIPDGYAIRMNADSSEMFANISFASIEIAGFDTSAVKNMSRMFSWCNALESLDVSGFDTSNVTDMSYMFSNCCKLTSLDVTGFDTSKVTNMKFMFNLCSELTSLDVSNFNTSAVTDMNAMFSSCSKLPSLDLHSFDTSAVEDMGSMFVACSSLESLDVSSFNTSAVTNMREMFYLCSELTSLDLSAFDTSAVTDMTYMFNACEKLAGIDLSSFDTRKVTNMGGMFQSCPALTSLDLSSFDTSAVTNMYGMFGGCSALETIYATNQFVTTNVESGYSSENCFEYCTSLKGGAGTTYDESKTSVTYARIDGGPDTDTPGYFTLRN